MKVSTYLLHGGRGCQGDGRRVGPYIKQLPPITRWAVKPSDPPSFCCAA